MSPPCCESCQQFLQGSVPRWGAVAVKREHEGADDAAACCPICLGVWSEPFRQGLQAAIQTAAAPYAGADGNNRFSRHMSPPLLILPGDLVYRYAYWSDRQKQQGPRPREDSSPLEKNVAKAAAAAKSSNSNSRSRPAPLPVLEFGQRLKQHAKSVLNQCLDELEKKAAAAAENSQPQRGNYPPCIEDEELGYLGVHVIALPNPHRIPYRPLHKLPVPKRQRKGRNKRFHHEEDTQGGDPRVNLERRLVQSLQQQQQQQRQDDSGGDFPQQHPQQQLWTINQALDANLKIQVTDHESRQLEQVSPPLKDDNDGDENDGTSNHSLFDFYVAVWRRPFYLRSMYTKTRRDVSQTPFHVVDHGKRRKLGATSVEEQITPAILRHCGGISTLNNESKRGGGGGDYSNNNTVFGMAKFHASGREDMDVKMLLPPPAEEEEIANIDDDDAAVNITGRPFCYEIYDAFQLPSPDSLASIAREVNHLDDNNDTPDPRSYGRNPMGVGIAPQLQFVPSSSFKQLQAETEEKIKHYGCLCWSEQPLPATNQELMAKLGCSASSSSSSYPLEIRQWTPVRVLHRRANTPRTRHVLSCRAHRVDDHYFRLHLSTEAGTYVKEFVHGDLGRTVPSVSSLLGCSTDILELDCEGIQF